MLSSSIFSAVGIKYQVNRAEIEQFVDTIFKHATNGFISLRVFTHKTETESSKPAACKYVLGADGEKHPLWPSVEIGSPGYRKSLIEGAVVQATIAANRLDQDADGVIFQSDKRLVFSPPIVTVATPLQARMQDAVEGVALSTECDGPDAEHPHSARPYDAYEKLCAVLGPPTITVLSGGIWNGEEMKWHAHYRLRVPTRTPEQHEKLKQARNLIARIIGGDVMGAPLVHPYRWPGSWHTKAEPRLATAEYRDDVEIDLDETLALLTLRADEMGICKPQAPEPRPSSPKHNEVEDIEDLCRAALQVIPNDMDRADWINMCFAMHDAGLDFNDWSDWCHSWTNGRNTDEAIRVAWNTCDHPSSITYRTLLKNADNADPSWRSKYYQHLRYAKYAEQMKNSPRYK